MPVFSAASDRGPLSSSTVFSITILNPSIPYTSNSHWILTDASSNTEIQKAAIPVRYNTTFIKVRNVLVRISASYTRYHNNFSPGNNFQMQLVIEKPAEAFPHLNTFWVSLPASASSECAEKLTICIS
ncbi:hypothetical protein TNCV_1958871 [Trichonephila clavipes]|nr:hypothetical protein TNCV_1958871 [Trichonephila clavipes]